ncbi:MAG: hypothetical protein N4A48_03215 [Tepidibacter sp.]|jgi:plasmid maintenance system killer protein|uniref:hypothetical protein n=1 Tax=Tepidibacter sp. TaxID=2529387 RepID=UPI0025DEB781|nr:hypothetical protein [Tepidibacter sp.]MCT4507757.1 hypothetical protein [Tepidibacter sp.]
MKENSKTNSKYKDINSKLDEAIDSMDMFEIEVQLEKLSNKEEFPYEIEDSKFFAKRIIKQSKKGNGSMRRNVKKSGILVACLVLTIGVTVAYGTGLFKNFKFYNEKTTVEIRTNQNISEEEAERIAKEAEDDYNSPSTEDTTEKDTKKIFSSIKEVEETIGMQITLPSYIPEDFQMEKDIMVYNTRGDNHNIYITYMSSEKEDRLLGITTITRNQPEDSTIITVTDAVHKNDYKTPSGTKYSILEEDEAIIATTDISNVQYALIFMGVNEEEMHKVINSTDLSGYIK